MKVYLLTSYHVDKDPKRDKELKTCLTINSKVFDHITLFGDQPFDFIGWNKDKIEWCGIKDRPFFTDFLSAIQCINDPDGIYVMANADIFFKDYTMYQLKKVVNWTKHPKTLLSLSRWDVHNFDYGTGTFTEQPFCRVDSQDAWVIKGIPDFTSAPYRMGIPGVDNKISLVFDQKGYKVFNPSRDLKIYHLHISNTRNYSLPDGSVIDRYDPPYLMVEPCFMADIK